jgi:heat shock protein HtpX
MMVIAVIFCGIFAFVGDLIFRGWDFPYGLYPRSRGSSSSSGGDWFGGGSSSKNDSKGGDIKGVLIAIVIALVIIAITWGVSTLLKFMLSRTREYLADAGAVELTKNPDALISALTKISANPKVEVISRMEAFFIENPLPTAVTTWFSTHPAIGDRVAALTRYAGGMVPVAQPA